MPPLPEPQKARPFAWVAPSLGAVDASERASELLLRNGLIFLIYRVPVSQKSCRATLMRVSKNALEKLEGKDVVQVFPSVLTSNNTVLLLKKPKTKSSIRRVWLPKTVALMLAEWKKNQDELKEILGAEYHDYNLVLSMPNGRPLEGQVISRSFKDLIRKHDLPDVVFHSLRHTSTTYKLKLNRGDMKAVQGDTGHAQLKMVSDVYSHILDEDRRNNAARFEEAFYHRKDNGETQTKASNVAVTAEAAKVLELLGQRPELAAGLLQLLSATQGAVQGI